MTKEEALVIAKKEFPKEVMQDRLIVLPITEDKADHYEKLGLELDESTKKQMKAEMSSTIAPAVVVAVGPGKPASNVAPGMETSKHFTPGDIVYCFPNQIEADIKLEDGNLYLIFKEDRIIMKDKPVQHKISPLLN